VAWSFPDYASVAGAAMSLASMVGTFFTWRNTGRLRAKMESLRMQMESLRTRIKIDGFSTKARVELSAFDAHIQSRTKTRRVERATSFLIKVIAHIREVAKLTSPLKADSLDLVASELARNRRSDEPSEPLLLAKREELDELLVEIGNRSEDLVKS
jgi:hypothetical protein